LITAEALVDERRPLSWGNAAARTEAFEPPEVDLYGAHSSHDPAVGVFTAGAEDALLRRRMASPTGEVQRSSGVAHSPTFRTRL